MTKTLPLALLATALFSPLAFADGFMLPATPNSMMAPPSPPVPPEQARTWNRLDVPVQVVHITVRHNGDREIRLVASGTIVAHDGEPGVWHGEAVQRVLHAPVHGGASREHYTVTTDEVRVAETVTVDWDSRAQTARISVRTSGQKPQETATTTVPTTISPTAAGVEHLAVDGPVIVGTQSSPSTPPSDRREIDAFFVGGPGGSDVDSVRVWDAVRRTYTDLPIAGQVAASAP